jgi:hypothetical protein
MVARVDSVSVRVWLASGRCGAESGSGMGGWHATPRSEIFVCQIDDGVLLLHRAMRCKRGPPGGVDTFPLSSAIEERYTGEACRSEAQVGGDGGFCPLSLRRPRFVFHLHPRSLSLRICCRANHSMSRASSPHTLSRGRITRTCITQADSV